MITFFSFNTGGDARKELASGTYGPMEVSTESFAIVQDGFGVRVAYSVVASSKSRLSLLSKWYVAGFNTDGTNNEEDFETALNLCRAKVGAYP